MEIKCLPSFDVEQLLDVGHLTSPFILPVLPAQEYMTSNNMNVDLNKELTFSFQHALAQIRRRFFPCFLMDGRLCVQSTECAGDRGVKIYNILNI